MRQTFIVILLAFSALALAQGPTGEPLTFKAWKEQQVIDAQNHLARVNNRIVLLRTGKVKPEEISAEFNNFKDSQVQVEAAKLTSRAQQLSSSDVLSRLDKELSRSQKGLDFAKDLDLQDYFLGYMVQFQENPDALAAVASRLSKEEVAELLKFLLKSTQPSVGSGEGKRAHSALGKLEASLR